MKYYIAIDNQPHGPYDIEGLKHHDVKPDTLLWAEGMSEWLPAGEIIEVKNALFGNTPILPPVFNPQEFAEQTRQTNAEQFHSDSLYNYDTDECPPTRMGLAIFGTILFPPLGIVAIIKATMVKRLWEEKRYNDAMVQSESAKKFAKMAILIGIPYQMIGVWYYANIYSQLPFYELF